MNNNENGQLNIVTPIQDGGEVNSANDNQVQLNQVGEGITPITPISDSSVSNGGVPINPITPTNMVQESSQEDLSKLDVLNNGNIIPVSPIPEVKDSGAQPVINNENVNNNIVSGDGIIPISPENVIPQSVNSNANLDNNSVMPELKLDSSSPFDIGINQPVSTDVSSVSNNVDNNVTSVTPMGVNSQEQNSNDQVVVPVNQDGSSVSSEVSNANNSNVSDGNVVSVGKYLLHMILFSIPVVGFIMLIVKAINKKDKNISNYAKAQLLLWIIMVVLGIVISVVFSSLLVNLIPSSTGVSMY